MNNNLRRLLANFTFYFYINRMDEQPLVKGARDKSTKCKSVMVKRIQEDWGRDGATQRKTGKMMILET